ncbi:MAG: DUF2946 family protein [Thauera sp.]|nr:DUF2946 family protein [Thauera sp.]
MAASASRPPAKPAASTPSALPDWPMVPACYGWLALDARGGWRLRGEPIDHPGLIAFLDARYTADEHGNWLVNNGPQRVYVALAAAPLILRLHPDGRLVAHTGREATASAPVLVDPDGCAFLATDLGPAMIDDRDLALFAAELRQLEGASAGDEDLLALIDGQRGPALRWRGIDVAFCARAAIPVRLGFQPRPQSVEP